MIRYSRNPNGFCKKGSAYSYKKNQQFCVFLDSARVPFLAKFLEQFIYLFIFSTTVLTDKVQL